MPLRCVNTLEMSVDLLQELARRTCKEGALDSGSPPKIRQEIHISPNSVPRTNMVCFENGFGPERKHAHFSTVRRNVIPYSDHNYGQPPPLTPPEPCSPDQNEQTDTGNEEEEDEEGVTRCICGFSHDDGYMICCDKCSAWQHIECMGISSDAVPEKYLCDRCQPRTLDVERAKTIQKKKREENSGDDDNDESESDDDAVASYTAVSSTPTRITLTANSSANRKKSKFRLSGNRLSINPPQKGQPKLPRTKKKKFEGGGSGEDFVAFWDRSCLDTYYEAMDVFEPIPKCRYESGLDVVLWQAPEDGENDIDYPITEQLCVVAKASEQRKGLFAARDIEKNTTVIELKGTVSLTPNFKSHSTARYCPFTIFYNELDHVDLLIDARKYGSEARYTRKSCTWNASVKHKVVDGSLHFLLCSHKFIPLGQEIVIGFEHPIAAYNTYLECACGLAENCPVTKHNVKFQATNLNDKAKFKELALRHTANPTPRRPQADSDSEDGHDVDVGSNEKPSAGRRNQLSREDRKLQAYLKQIEKMEKKEQKPRDVKQGTPRSSIEELQGSNITKDKILVARKCGRRKMSFTKGKRPRLSSCSSEPLSPDVDVMMTQITTPSAITTPSFLSDMANRPRSMKRDRPGGGPAISMLGSDKHQRPTSLAKRLKQETTPESTNATARGSPTPPSTPGQLSPIPKVLCIQTEHPTTPLDRPSAVSPFANSILAHTSPSASMDSRRLSVGSLLQVVTEQSDSSCSSQSGSPYPSHCITTTGASTYEEKVGDVLRGSHCNSLSRDSLDSPLAALEKKLAQQRPFYGSLKKRWLDRLYYDSSTIERDVEPNQPCTISLSAVMSNSLLHAKMASAQSSQQMNAALNRLPLKKRRLKSALNSASSKDAFFGGSDDTSSPSASELEKYRQDRPKLTLSSFRLSTSTTITHRTKTDVRGKRNATVNNSDSRGGKALSVVANAAPAGNCQDIVEQTTLVETDCPSSTKPLTGDHAKSMDCDDALPPELADALSTESDVSVSNSLSVITCSDAPADREQAPLAVSTEETQPKPSSSDVTELMAEPVDAEVDTTTATAPIEIASVASGPVAVDSSDASVKTSDCHSPGGEDADCNEPSSTVEEVLLTPQRICRENSERRESVSSTSSDKSDHPGTSGGGGSGGKKKMSLSEYRNRQRTKPAAVTPSPPVSQSLSRLSFQPNFPVQSSDSPQSSVPSSCESIATETLSARADSLLTPRTLSLSGSYSSSSHQPRSPVTSPACDPPSDCVTPTSAPVFEPVSPTNEEEEQAAIISRGSSMLSVSSSGIFSYGVSAAHSVTSLQGTVYMRGQPFCYSSVGSSVLPASSHQSPALGYPMSYGNEASRLDGVTARGATAYDSYSAHTHAHPADHGLFSNAHVPQAYTAGPFQSSYHNSSSGGVDSVPVPYRYPPPIEGVSSSVSSNLSSSRVPNNRYSQSHHM